MVMRILCCVLLLTSIGAAQSFVRSFAQDFAHDQKRIWTSPFHMNKRQFWTLAVPLVGGTVALKSLDRSIVEGLPNSRDQIRWGDRISNAGTAYTLGIVLGGTTVYGATTSSPRAKAMGRNGLLALSDALVVTYAIKLASWRERPNAPNTRGSFYSGGSGFPSGHSMSSFAVAAAMAGHPRCPKWLGVTLYATAAVIGLSRIAGNRHYPADVYFGAFSGILIGNMVARTQR